MNEDRLKLSNQLCFPLYACSKEVVRHYRPFLDKIGLTYTQEDPAQRPGEDALPRLRHTVPPA